MSALTFRLKETPPLRLDASALMPSRLQGLGTREIAALALTPCKTPVRAGDVFQIAGSDVGGLRFEGDLTRVDFLGAGLEGETQIHVEGRLGAYAGSGMRSGALTISGGTGPFAGAGMMGGTLSIGGEAGDHLGGARLGDTAGMRGGLIHVRGNAGAQAANRMRRGVIFIEGGTGAYPGSEMLAGTLVILGEAGPRPGVLLRRGSIVMARAFAPPPSFADCGVQDFVWLRVLKRDLLGRGLQAAGRLASEARRFAGDMASLGKGEILALAM